MNKINFIKPYKYEYHWVFDDDRFELVKEPFVAGSNRIIDMMTENIPDAESGFALLFSSNKFPFYNHEFTLDREEGGGYWYIHRGTGAIGWLCPAFDFYFDKAPANLFVAATSLTNPVEGLLQRCIRY